jgi:hypothetical protein
MTSPNLSERVSRLSYRIGTAKKRGASPVRDRSSQNVLGHALDERARLPARNFRRSPLVVALRAGQHGRRQMLARVLSARVAPRVDVFHGRRVWIVGRAYVSHAPAPKAARVTFPEDAPARRLAPLRGLLPFPLAQEPRALFKPRGYLVGRVGLESVASKRLRGRDARQLYLGSERGKRRGFPLRVGVYFTTRPLPPSVQGIARARLPSRR